MNTSKVEGIFPSKPNQIYLDQSQLSHETEFNTNKSVTIIHHLKP